MAKRLVLVFLLIATTVSLPLQNASAESQDRNSYSASHNTPRQQVATIIFAGLAGAVLGLSTLSFYGRPQDRLANIGVGFALGVIAGATYTTYKAATRPYENYESALTEPEDRASVKLKKPIMLSFSWEF